MLTANFDNEFENGLITNCGISFYGYTPRTVDFLFLFDQAKIKNFSMTRKNSGVCEVMPTDTCVFDIVNWFSLSQAVRNFLLVKHNYVCMSFMVGGISTTNYLVLQIDNCFVDEQENTAKVRLADIYSIDITNDSFNPLINQEDAMAPIGLVMVPKKNTIAEKIQTYSIGLGKGVRLPPIRMNMSSGYIVSEYKDLSSIYQTPVMFYKKNFKKYSKYMAEDRKNIIAYGSTPNGSYKQLHIVTMSASSTSTRISGAWLFIGIDLPAITSFKVTRTYSSQTTDVTSDFQMAVSYGATMITQKEDVFLGYGSYTIYWYGYDSAVFNEPDTNDVHIKCLTQLVGTSGLSNVQDSARAYYSFDKYLDIDCIRINPRIEPLDNVIIDNVGLIVVEEIDIDFNGGFSGKIKGRLIFDNQPIPPKVSNISYNLDTFSFTITNYNPFSVSLYIEYSSGTLVGNIPASSSKVFTQTDFPQLSDSFVEKADGNLGSDVSCYFVEQDWEDSDSAIILEADY